MSIPIAVPKESAAWYAAPIGEFAGHSTSDVIGRLVLAGGGADEAQVVAWQATVEILRSALASVEGWVALEFNVPRIGSRIDAVVVTAAAVIPIEFKIGAGEFSGADIEQTWDYGLDLKNFHSASHSAQIFPILVASEASSADSEWLPSHADGVRPPRKASIAALGGAIREAAAVTVTEALDASTWFGAAYRPTPGIIEAARALYARNSVTEIARADADATNLHLTAQSVEQVIASAAESHFKAIVFVTGVPGAGKTLVGLNIATRHRLHDDATHASYLSGNGPLVAVLREALTRDEVKRRRGAGKKVRKGDVSQEVQAFIQPIHHFRKDGLRTLESCSPPDEHVVIFDEAQRAWDRSRTSDFVKKKNHIASFNQSEPQFLIGYMDRHPDWAVIVCLVGGGQDINRGEAGISTWLEALQEHFSNWRVYVPDELREPEYAADEAIAKLEQKAIVTRRSELHLRVSMRSFRAGKVSAFVSALLAADNVRASNLLSEVKRTYPICLTRSLELAKRWTRQQARGSERFGLVATSYAERLKPHAINVRASIDPVHWFLNEATDTRSSFYLEDPATEYQIQGLELDWVCVSWDADLRMVKGKWDFKSFKSSQWQRVTSVDRRRYLVNAYRVILTRARQGMVIFVPEGDEADSTRKPELYDGTYAFLRGLGVPELT